MTIWEQLGIEKTRDKRKIKRAYAKQAAKYHPEEHPEEFKELYEAYQRALSYAERPAFDEDTDAFILEELINATSSPQPPEREEEESRIDFSTFDIDKAPSAEELIQMRLIDEILHNMQTIIEKPEKGIARKIAKTFLGRLFDRQLEEWKNLLASSDFQKVRNDRNFIVKLNELECISLLSGDMAECLYKELDFILFEKKDYQKLKIRLQQCINKDAWRRQITERVYRRVKWRMIRLGIIFTIIAVGLMISLLSDIVNSKLTERKLAAIQTQLQEKYHQEFVVAKLSYIMGSDYRYLCEVNSATDEYEWFSTAFWDGNGIEHKCMITWKKGEGMQDSVAYELIENYRQQCNAIKDFHYKLRWRGEAQNDSYQYKKDGITYDYPIYGVQYSYKKNRAYSIEEIQQLKEWIHKIQDQDMLFVHTPYITLLFQGLHGEEYELKLTQNYDEVDYHTLIKKLEEFRWRGKKKGK